MPFQIISYKVKRFLPELLLALLILLPTAEGFAEPVKIDFAIEGNRLQIILDWAKAVSFKVMVDEVEAPSGTEGQELLLSFDKAIETSDMEIRTKKTYAWMETNRTGCYTLRLQARDKVR